MAQNVLGGELADCSHDPVTGFYRDGCCETGPDDAGVHTVCARVTEEFLTFSAARGNDLTRPAPGSPGCPRRSLVLVREPVEGSPRRGAAPPVVLEATHARTLEWVDLADLQAHAIT